MFREFLRVAYFDFIAVVKAWKLYAHYIQHFFNSVPMHDACR